MLAPMTLNSVPHQTKNLNFLVHLPPKTILWIMDMLPIKTLLDLKQVSKEMCAFVDQVPIEIEADIQHSDAIETPVFRKVAVKNRHNLLVTIEISDNFGLLTRANLVDCIRDNIPFNNLRIEFGASIMKDIFDGGNVLLVTRLVDWGVERISVDVTARESCLALVGYPHMIDVVYRCMSDPSRLPLDTLASLMPRNVQFRILSRQAAETRRSGWREALKIDQLVEYLQEAVLWNSLGIPVSLFFGDILDADATVFIDNNVVLLVSQLTYIDTVRDPYGYLNLTLGRCDLGALRRNLRIRDIKTYSPHPILNDIADSLSEFGLMDEEDEEDDDGSEISGFSDDDI